MHEKYCIINLKAYEEVFDTNLATFIEEVEKCSNLANELGVNLVLCINSYDLKQATQQARNIQIYAQHVDPVDFGSKTGHFPSICAIRLGAIGTLISHSEFYLSLDDTLQIVEHTQKQHLTTCVCSRDNTRLEELKSNNVKGLVALELPELIGGDISVTTANPNIISQAVEITKNSNMELLVGAGIKSKEDVSKAIELGAKGILVASGIVKSSNVEQTLKNLLEGFK